MAPLLQTPSDAMRPTSHLLDKLTRLRARLLELVRDKKGAVTTEYVVVVGTTGLLLVGALVSVGPLLLASYERSRALLIAPFP